MTLRTVRPDRLSGDGGLLLSRVCCVGHDGLLTSPSMGTPWPRLALTADSWSDDAAVLGRCGLHGIWRPDHLDRLVPYRRDEAVCLVRGYGRAVVGETGARVERQIIDQIITTAPSIADAIRARYPDADVVVRARRTTGLRVTQLADGGVVRERYRDGQLHGSRVHRYPGGVVRERYRDGQLHGSRVHRYPSGVVVRELYRDGQRQSSIRPALG